MSAPAAAAVPAQAVPAPAVPALAVEGLRVELHRPGGAVPVLEDLSFTVEAGRTLALVGESGCGKSMAALAVMGLLPDGLSAGAGSIRLAGQELAAAGPRQMRSLRGRAMSMIFQEPMTALNPVFTVGEQIAEVLRRHQGASRRAAHAAALALLRAVQVPAPEQRVGAYPHQLSGGMRQRVMIAMALACRPALLIADEPTTALDVTVQAQVFDLLRDMQRQTGTAMMLITHDMTAVADMADTVAVLYAGRCIEQGRTADVLGRPAHPYTQGLIACVPHLRLGARAAEPAVPLAEIPGMVPPLGARGDGCVFAPRCPRRDAQCATRPPLDGTDHRVACWHPG